MHAQENQVYTTLIIAAIVFAFIIFYFFYSMLRQHKRVRELERQNANAQVTALEKDRSRIATDLHDDLAPVLTAVGLNMKTMERSNEIDKEVLQKTIVAIDNIAKQMRTIAYDLMPTNLREKGLQSAIEQFVNYVSNNNTLEIHFAGPRRDLELDEQTTIHIYRIVQEIIHNTIKHAQAKQLIIMIQKEKDYLVLATNDDGVGFDYKQQLTNGKGLGLKSLVNRIYLLQAEFLMDSKPGKGTIITIRIPQHNG